eukprot:COSAG06_NODE_53373_length_300_cov_1.024876_1_plen_81_part_01
MGLRLDADKLLLRTSCRAATKGKRHVCFARIASKAKTANAGFVSARLDRGDILHCREDSLYQLHLRENLLFYGVSLSLSRA